MTEILEGEDNRLRKVMSENLLGVRTVYCDPSREDGTTSGMHSIDGYYKLPGNEITIRQMRVYDTKTVEEAVERAREDGLAQGIMAETFLGEPQKCLDFSKLKIGRIQDLAEEASSIPLRLSQGSEQ